MRLSDVKGERTFEVIAAIIDPIANIAEDGEVADAFTAKELPKGMEPRQFMLQRIRTAVPAIVGRHRDDVVAILAAVAGVEPSKYLEQTTIASLFSDVYDLVTDEALLAFLSSRDGGSGTSSASTGE